MIIYWGGWGWGFLLIEEDLITIRGPTVYVAFGEIRARHGG